MKIFKLLFTAVICASVFSSCGENTPPRQPGQTPPTGLTIEERKDIFASYFNHNISYVTGRYIDEKTVEKADGTIFEYQPLCREESSVYSHPMTGSLDYNIPVEKGEEIIIFYVKGDDGTNHAKTISPVAISDKYNRTPGKEGESRFEGFDDPRMYYRNMASEIRKSLDDVDMPAVLTLDEAMSVFWQESGLEKSRFLLKTGSHGNVYYQHKTENHIITATVNLLCTQTEGSEGAATVYNPDMYNFIILQSKKEENPPFYVINIDGSVTATESVYGISKS